MGEHLFAVDANVDLCSGVRTCRAYSLSTSAACCSRSCVDATPLPERGREVFPESGVRAGWFREVFALARDHGTFRATDNRCSAEVIYVPAEQAPDLADVLRQSKTDGASQGRAGPHAVRHRPAGREDQQPEERSMPLAPVSTASRRQRPRRMLPRQRYDVDTRRARGPWKLPARGSRRSRVS